MDLQVKEFRKTGFLDTLYFEKIFLKTFPLYDRLVIPHVHLVYN